MSVKKSSVTKRPGSVKSQRKSGRVVTPPTNGAAEVGTKRPGYLVVFREPSPKNTSVLSAALKVGEDKTTKVRSGTVLLRANHEWAARPRMYERMNIAAVDLDPAEREKLRKNDQVKTIVRNQIRRIPPIRTSGAYEAAGVETMATAEAPASPGAISMGLRGAAQLSGPAAYAAGLRDAASMILASLTYPVGPPVLTAESVGTHSWCLKLVGLDQGYSRSTGHAVRVAVLDTGVDLDHPDLSVRLDPLAGVESFIPGETVRDGNGHGTHCAGVVASNAGASAARRYGVAPDAELLIGKVLSDAGEGYDDQILAGIDWAADAGAQVISMSLGSDRGPDEPYSEVYETVARNYLDQTPGLLIIAAAGNESYRPWYTRPVGNPAACPSIISVAAIDSQKRVGSFSCAQMDSVGEVNLSAPGVAVYSSWRGSGYRTISGTSMATPHVSGVAALHLAMNNGMTARQLWEALRQSCVPLGSAADFGAGLVQVP